MKIMLNDGKCCYTQLRDLGYMADRYNSSTFENLYNGYIDGAAQEEFVYLDDERVVRLIEYNPNIIDFGEYANLQVNTLVRLASLCTGNEYFGRSLDGKHKMGDILDVIDFKKGLLDYKIPVLFDGKTVIDFKNAVLGSSTIPGYYLIKKKDSEVDLAGLVTKRYQVLFGLLGLEGEVDGVQLYNVDGNVLFKFKVKNKIVTMVDKLKKKLN